MLDRNGFRLNVGIILANTEGKLFWGKRAKPNGWQFPQGGVNPYETLEEAMYRELTEEVGLTKDDIKILAVTKRWLTYRLPSRLKHQGSASSCIGQKQKWFLLLLTSKESKINLNYSIHPEFSKWKWIGYWEPLRHIIYFKRDVYFKALKELEPFVKV
jgi:putative (di)nucleoside polyphosphate hydrolase